MGFHQFQQILDLSTIKVSKRNNVHLLLPTRKIKLSILLFLIINYNCIYLAKKLYSKEIWFDKPVKR